MAFPSNIFLASSAKYFGFVDPKMSYNAHWDITWSFTFALTGSEHGFCTFLTTNPLLSTGLPGQYLGYLGNYPYILTESGEYLLTESGERLTYEATTLSAYDTNGVLAIAFDSTGYFALSDADNSGLPINDIKRNSLTVRNNNGVVCHDALSALDTSFFLSSSVKNYQTLRFRLANGDKLYIDYKKGNADYKNLKTVSLSNFSIDENLILYPAFSFSSPISSISIKPSTLWLKNFHTQGNTSEPTYEILPFNSIYPSNVTYTTISGITANPIE
jgi:hypothetical protein